MPAIGSRPRFLSTGVFEYFPDVGRKGGKFPVKWETQKRA